MAVDLTQNPLYRRVYGQNNPLVPQQSWQPPSEYVPRINYAAQDVNNLLGNFFTQNYTPQYQPVTTQAYQTASARPSSQFDAQPLLAYANQSDSNNRAYYQPTPIRNDNPNAWQDLQNEAYKTFQDQVVQSALTALMSGGAVYGLWSATRPSLSYGMGKLGATRYGAPVVKQINKFAQTPLGDLIKKAADKTLDLFW